MDEKALNEMQNNRERVDLSPLGIPQVEKKELTVEERKANMKEVMEMFKRQYLHKYNIEGIDLEAELKLINEKKSRLSRSQRDAVVGYFMIFPAADERVEKMFVKESEIENIGEPATEADLEKAARATEGQDIAAACDEFLKDGVKDDGEEKPAE